MKKFGCSQKKNLFEIITSELDFIIKKQGLKPKLHVVAGAAGFEPTNVGTKSRCLTTWRRPNKKYPKNKAASVVH